MQVAKTRSMRGERRNRLSMRSMSVWLTGLLAAMTTLLGATPAQAQPVFGATISARFSPTTAAVGSSVDLIFTVTNPNSATTLTNLHASVSYDLGNLYLVGSNQGCINQNQSSPGAIQISSLAPGASCQIAYVFDNASAGTKHGSASAVTANEANGTQGASATLLVTANPIPTTTTVTSSINPSTAGQIVTFTATVSDNAGVTPDGSVQFYVDNVAQGASVGLTNGQAQFTTSSLATGSRMITARYGGSGQLSAAAAGR